MTKYAIGFYDYINGRDKIRFIKFIESISDNYTIVESIEDATFFDTENDAKEYGNIYFSTVDEDPEAFIFRDELVVLKLDLKVKINKELHLF